MGELPTLNWVQGGAAVVLVSLGILLMLTGSLGILRLPDFYSRSHATSKVDTVGIILLLAGLAVNQGMTQNAVKLLLAILFVGLANPVSAHALARSALKFGLKPWTSKRQGAGDKRE